MKILEKITNAWRETIEESSSCLNALEEQRKTTHDYYEKKRDRRGRICSSGNDSSKIPNQYFQYSI